MRALPAFCVLVALGGCGQSSSARCAGVTMPLVQARVFDGCSTAAGGGCHIAAPFGANLDLSRDLAWVDLVHAPSSSAPGKFRVEPGDLDGSFLWHKLRNELASDGSEGAPMPRDRNDKWAPLSDDQLAAVRCWISDGASR